MVAATGMSNEEAANIADEKRYLSIERGEDFSFETVLSSKYKLDIIKKAKSRGYFIKCIFILTADASVNVARVAARVASGGHDVHESKIRSRYTKSLNNISKLMEICDILHVFDNTIEPVRIIRKHKEDISIFPNEIWSEEQILDLIQGKYHSD
jgi:predicted ABC-type ATPase